MEPTKKQDLDSKIASSLDEAMSLMPEKGRAIILYEGKVSYIAFSDGIRKDWKGRMPNGDPITRGGPVTKDEFLQWVGEQNPEVKRKVYQNLSDYIATETPKERGEIEFPESEYLFGY